MNKRFAQIRQQYMGNPDLPRQLYDRNLDDLMKMNKKERLQFIRATKSVIKTLNHDYPNGVIVPEADKVEAVKTEEKPSAETNS